jgi:hypothetical protein
MQGEFETKETDKKRGRRGSEEVLRKGSAKEHAEQEYAWSQDAKRQRLEREGLLEPSLKKKLADLRALHEELQFPLEVRAAEEKELRKTHTREAQNRQFIADLSLFGDRHQIDQQIRQGMARFKREAMQKKIQQLERFESKKDGNDITEILKSIKADVATYKSLCVNNRSLKVDGIILEKIQKILRFLVSGKEVKDFYGKESESPADKKEALEEFLTIQLSTTQGGQLKARIAEIKRINANLSKLRDQLKI